MTHNPNETPEPLAQEQAGEMEHGGELGMVESHPNFVAGFKAGHAAGRKRATAAIQAKDAEIAGLKADAGQRVPMVTTLFGTPGTLMFKATDGRWFYMNHADTWQSCPAPFAAAMKGEAA